MTDQPHPNMTDQPSAPSIELLRNRVKCLIKGCAEHVAASQALAAYDLLADNFKEAVWLIQNEDCFKDWSKREMWSEYRDRREAFMNANPPTVLSENTKEEKSNE